MKNSNQIMVSNRKLELALNKQNRKKVDQNKLDYSEQMYMNNVPTELKNGIIHLVKHKNYTIISTYYLDYVGYK